MRRRILFVVMGLVAIFVATTIFLSAAAKSNEKPTVYSYRYTDNPIINEILGVDTIEQDDPFFNDVQNMLNQQAITLNRTVINKVLTTLQCASQYYINNPVLVIIDYSLPANEKRFWVFDLNQKKLLFHTYVAHGLKTGALLSNYFSNKHDSKASSIGVFKTENAYHGREGLTLKLEGLDKGFNDNAMSRYIVMHGGWYVEENFIKHYGRPGRSWGCPVVPHHLTKPIINTIKNQALFVVYYPSDQWFAQSNFLNCKRLLPGDMVQESVSVPVTPEKRDYILFADLNGNNQREENEPILVMAAEDYEKQFQTKAPLERMLRRRIRHTEYIALNPNEFKTVLTQTKSNSNNLPSSLPSIFAQEYVIPKVYFVVPEVTMDRGYYMTKMKIISLGAINDVRLDTENATNARYTVYLQGKSSVFLKQTNQFIRWLGL